MKPSRAALPATAFFIALFLAPCAHAVQPICRVRCAPDPTSSTYAPTIVARPMPNNGRGGPGPTTPVHPTTPKSKAAIGSASYDYALPLLSLPGRNGLDLNLTLYYNSDIWTLDSTHNTVTLNADRDFPSYGFRLDFGYLEFDFNSQGYILTDPDGTKHLLTNSGGGFWDSTDSSYIDFNNSSNILTEKDGTRTTFQAFPSASTLFRPVQIEDTNGNYISISYLAGYDQELSTITDTLGRIVTFNYDAGPRLSSIIQGGKTFTFSWNTAYALNYSFSTPVIDSPATGSASNVLTGVTLPNGTYVSFDYGDWGIVNRIEQHSANGALRSYTAYNFPAASAGAQASNPTYTQQTVFDGVNTVNWTLSSSLLAPTGPISSSSITDPAGTTTITNFNTAGWQQGLISSIQVQDSGGTTLRTITNTWESDTGTNANPRLSSVVTKLETADQYQVQYGYDSNGNISDLKEFNFDGTLLRETVTTFTPLANHILDRATQILVKDSTGTTVSRSDIQYDNYAGGLSTPSPAASNHDLNFSAADTNRGNPTKVTRYTNASAGTGAIARSFSYDIYGNTVLAQLDCCNQKQWNFSSVTQYGYPDSVLRGSSGSQLTTQFTYNVATGTLANTTDENGQVTTYSYNTSDRLIGVTYPDQVTETYSYDDNAAEPSSTYSTSANSLVRTTTSDGLQRTVKVQVLNGASVVSTVDTARDGLGRPASVSSPYAPGETPVYTIYAYDALGRTTTVTPPGSAGSYTTSYAGFTQAISDPASQQKKDYFDSLGRLTRVDEPGGGSYGAQGSGTMTVNGTLQTTSVGGYPAAAGTGNITFNGADQSKQVQTSPGSQSTVLLTIGGVEQQGPCSAHLLNSCIAWYWNSGIVKITVNGCSSTANYGQNSTSLTVAHDLWSNFSCGTVTASLNSNTVRLTSTAFSSGANYSFSASYTWFTTYFSGPSFTISPGNGNMANGADPTYNTVYDSGVATITVNGHANSISWGQGATGTGIAAVLAANINNDAGAPENASASGNVVYLTSKLTGAATNYSLSSGSTYDSGNFGGPSFTTSSSGGAFTGGKDAYNGNPVTDQGTLSVTVNSSPAMTKSVNYGPSPNNSTAAAVAQAIAQAFNSDGASPVWVSVPANTSNIVFTSRLAGGDFSVTANPVSTQTPVFSPPSFTASNITMSGGVATTPASLSTPNSTSYSYDPTGNLLKVTQGAQTRTYVYDGMGRLSSATIPESGTTTYSYTDFGEVQTRTDARGITSTYGYDPLNQLNSITYSDGVTPAVSFTHGGAGAANFGAGRLISMTDGAGSESYTYDDRGRMLSLTKIVGGTSYAIGYGYNTAGELHTLAYPSGRVVTQDYDAIGRLSQISTAGSSLLAVPSGGYNAAGEVLNANYGNGVQATFGYNARLQLASLQYRNSQSVMFSLGYSYGSANNGQIQGITDNVNSSQSTSYTYDALGRLQQAQTNDLSSPNTWRLNWTYDQYGNRVSQALTGGTASATQPQLTVDPASNRITTPGYGYDAAGNQTSDGQTNYTFDAENRITQSVSNGVATNYAYEGNGMRVQKGATVYIRSGSSVITEYSGGALANEYVYSGSSLLATIATGVTTYHHPDHLSPRLDTDVNGNQVRTNGSFPFGDAWYETGAANKWKFTSYERDPESGLDYAIARSYSNRLGRFTSADLLSGQVSDPQSLNHYAYVQNDPVNEVDPLGLKKMPIWRDCIGVESADELTSSWTCYDDSFNLPDPTEPPDKGGAGGGPGAARRRALARIKNDCLAFILSTIQKAYDSLNAKYPPNKDVLENQKTVTTGAEFSRTLAGANLVPASKPNPRYAATGNFVSTIEIHPGFYDAGNDQAETLIHETFHLNPYGFTDSQLASALKIQYKPGNTAQQEEENASEAWDKALQKHCGKTSK